jgi:ABC-2 type transport system permease protein
LELPRQGRNMANRFSTKPAKSFRSMLTRGVAIAKKDAKVYYFKPQIFGFGILIPTFVYLSFSLGRQISADLLIPGLVGMVSLFGASSVEAISIPLEKQTETYELLQTAPISTATIVFGKGLAGSAFGMTLSLITAIVAVELSGAHVASPFLFVIAVAVGAFVFSALGMVVASAVKDTPTANMSLTALRLPMIFISGVFTPVLALPVPLRVISYLTPLTYLVDSLRESLIGPGMVFWLDVFAMVTWFVALQALAVVVLNRARL